MPIEQRPEGKGSKEVAIGHTFSPTTGRTTVPTATGPNHGLQMGRDNTVASPSTMVMPDGSTREIVPPAAARAASVPPAAPVAIPATGFDALPIPAASPIPAVSPAVAVAPVAAPAPVPPPAAAAFTAEPPENIKPARVQVNMYEPGAEGKPPRLLYRARFHSVVPSRTLVVLVWDNRFPYADAPLISIPMADDPVPIILEIKAQDGGAEYPVVYMGFEFDDGPFTYFVLPKQQ